MAKFELEKVENQQNMAIPSEAKKVVGVEGDIYVWPLFGGGVFYAVGSDFVNLQESVYGIGKTTDKAINDLSDQKQDADLSGRPESTEDGSCEGPEQLEHHNEGQGNDAAEGSTEP